MNLKEKLEKEVVHVVNAHMADMNEIKRHLAEYGLNLPRQRCMLDGELYEACIDIEYKDLTLFKVDAWGVVADTYTPITRADHARIEWVGEPFKKS